MEKKYIEATGKTVDEAVLVAAAQLGVNKDKIEYEVLEMPEKALFGIIQKKDAKIKASVVFDIVELAEKYLEELFERMDIDAKAEVTMEDGTLHAELTGTKMGVLIGKRGETLDSIRYLLNLYINRYSEEKLKVIVDTEGYLLKREETLKKLAVSIAHRVKKTRKRVILEPMNSYERRIIHATLQDDPYVKTLSEGEDPYRKVIIVLK